jgi:1-acyl-sn-glycerol-3-phosphate acyltransferase
MNNLPYHLFMLVTNIWTRTLFQMRVHGRKNVPRQGPLLLVGNHFGKLWVDLAVLPALWGVRRPVMTTYGTLRGNKKTPRPLSMGASVFRMITAGPRGQGTGIKAAREILRELDAGEAVFMMLAGEVSWHGRLNEPRPAVAWTAIKSGVPVLPCAILGTYDIWPRWQEKANLTGKITVRFGTPFKLVETEPDRITSEMVDEGGQRIKKEIQKLIDDHYH